jgi:hypothetical protein
MLHQYSAAQASTGQSRRHRWQRTCCVGSHLLLQLRHHLLKLAASMQQRLPPLLQRCQLPLQLRLLLLAGLLACGQRLQPMCRAQQFFS